MYYIIILYYAIYYAHYLYVSCCSGGSRVALGTTRRSLVTTSYVLSTVTEQEHIQIMDISCQTPNVMTKPKCYDLNQHTSTNNTRRRTYL